MCFSKPRVPRPVVTCAVLSEMKPLCEADRLLDVEGGRKEAGTAKESLQKCYLKSYFCQAEWHLGLSRSPWK